VSRPKKKVNIPKKLKQKMNPNPFPRNRYTQSAKLRKSPALKQKGSVHFKHHKLSYRLPVLLTLLSLLLLILIIPSVIVLPFGKEKLEATLTREEPVVEDAGPEAISVAVMRDKSDTIEDVSLESYIVGVVAAEMAPDFDMEALKAQALAARTYTVSHLMGKSEESTYDITDTVQHQVYKNDQELQEQWGSAYEKNIKKIRSAVEATKGEILTYNDTPIMPAFFSMSNGYMENSEDYWENELPYLRSVASPWELDNPKLLSQETFSAEELQTLLAVDLSQAASTDMVIARKESGRVDQLTIEGHTFTGREVRDKLNLRSSDFSVKQNNGHFTFTTKGFGHGIGMSQYGADGMAKEGKTYQEIVKYYYQGVEISSLDETVPTLVSK